MSDHPTTVNGPGAALGALLKREFRLASRKKQDYANPLVFNTLVIILFPLGVSSDSAFLQQASAGVIWVAALLSTMLILDHLFRPDFEDGSLEQIVLSGQPLYILIIGKLICAWMLTGLPLVLLSPLMAILMQFPMEHLDVLMASLLLGTPALILIGAIGAALTVSLSAGGVLVSLLVLPLTVPVLIFGTGVVQASVDGLPVGGTFAILGALSVASLTLAPFACSASLKMHLASS